MKISVKNVALFGMMIATLEAGKLVLSAIPNVEIVSLLVILYTLYFGRRSIYAVVAFVVLECFLWGIGLWTIMYLYIWPLLAIVTYFFRKIDSVWFWSIFSAIFGLMFGGLCSIVYLAMGGPRTALAWWIAGMPWDLIHGVSNFAIMWIMYRPLGYALKKVIKTEEL